MAGLIVFDPDNEEVGLSTGDDIAVNTFLDIQSDTLYFTDGEYIYEWEGDDTVGGPLRQTYIWRSGEVRMPNPVNMGAALVEAENYSESIGAVVGDDDFASVILLSKHEGADAATAYTEIARSEPAIFNGTAQLDTGRFIRGTSSLLLNGTTDWIEYGTDATDWAAYQLASTDDVVVEGFVYFDSLPTTGNQMGLVGAAGQDFVNFDAWIENNGGTYELRGRFGFGNTPAAAITVTTGVWYYFAVHRRYGGVGDDNVDLYWGTEASGIATRVGTVVSNNNPSGGTQEPIRLGARVTLGTTETDFLAGSLDDVRITKALRYGSSPASYTIPTDFLEQASSPGTTYDITFRLYAEGVLKHTQIVTDDEPFRLPGGYLSNIYSVEIESALPVTRVSVAENIFELAEG